MEIDRWDVLLVNLDPTIGKEIKKTRPAIVVSPDEINHHWSPVVIVPLTSKLRDIDFRTHITFQGIKGQAAIDQIKAIDKLRIVKRLGKLRAHDFRRLQEDLLIFFGE